MNEFGIIYANPKIYKIGHSNPKEFTIGYNNHKIFTINEITNWFDYLRSLMDFLWIGNINGDKLLSRTDDRYATITNKDFVGTIIPSTSVSTFSLQPDADYIADDLDECWFAGGISKHLTVNDLIGTDWNRTIVLYPNASPTNISAIALFKSTTILTDMLRDQIVHDFLLWIFWSEIHI